MLPKIKETKKSRSYIEEFRGYNRRARIAENEFHDCYNISNDDYPVLSTRAPRGFKKTIHAEDLLGVLRNDHALCMVIADEGSDFLYYNDCKFGLQEDYNGYERQLICFGSKVIVLPDYFVLDTTNVNNYKTHTSSTTSLKTFEIVNAYQNDAGRIIDVPVVSSYNLENRDERHYAWVKRDGSEDVLRNSKGVEITKDRLLLKVKQSFFSAEDANKIEEVMLNLPSDLGINITGDGVDIVAGDIILKGYNDKFHSVKAKNGNISTQVYYTELWLDSSYQDYSIDVGIKFPKLDFVVEAQNRLWGCRYGENAFGEFVNELYCTALGTYNEWYRYEGLADSSWAASVGSQGNFTGALVLGGTPIFFKENVAYKIYPSASGAHQVVALEIRGVAPGTSDAIVYINEGVIYKGTDYFFFFDGSHIAPISESLGKIECGRAVAGVDGDKYVCCLDTPEGTYILTYDTRYGFWQKELCEPERYISGMVNRDEGLELLYKEEEDGKTIVTRMRYRGRGEETDGEKPKYMFESGEIGFSSPDSKYLIRLDMRVRLDFGATFNVWVQYDGDGKYYSVARLVGVNPTPKSEVVYVMPRRCDHFRIKVTGTGIFKLYSISKVFEEFRR